ncbi:nitrogenase cofactor biosynthesis protein NifB [Zymomonas mobilis]|uniref:FeMo cofactor biosynthesis protein NifB n=1 Tax=Zymomonas mobilis subsp. pomaceae (strain ATCC 29192 / DSM 22645 / JCM 10191 / CCUG 17912 / NBRC 13757 / NCIMB 11200 / NRRL B-4491 / Barker I) TaxID=579138 RepID=F8EUR1_ZYMMT|nr:nitrogenase cofactor biosynthesis protein NifB [Zymomonas mobilis]AEI38207.1 nitrogenase cofactor biosynthesis protein NifB [Zymomonas mobilis subsp. pomaceae ATCC 29192]MDX5947897.1 nitrogenase cofactor biosynthesis protein NifB [Zymomonas mobilis subsp. pomaceae]GEB89938.1 FeMo cofactor biosynthesis protein NifB [Zymomonas mobilis subsp. pomaceae]
MAQLINIQPLKSALAQPKSSAPSSQGCASSSCGSSSGKETLPPEIWAKVKDHPCYSEDAHQYFARMHVAVAPACNIQCNYCNRKYDCANESRPGVVSERMTPEQALRKVVTVANEVSQLSVLGIAGPGDACYDWDKTRETFELVAETVPDVKFCLSTNGLALPDCIDDITRMNIDHVTLTINMVDPEIGAKIYPWIFFEGKRWTGVEASKILHERQMLGLELLKERGILAKVNSVMIPGINDEHLIEVNRVVKEKGAFLHNVMPLISDPAHGTHFGLIGQRGPTNAELMTLQNELADGTKLMRHCRQCRADAIGMLGEDRGQEFTMDKVAEEVTYNPAKRDSYREIVAQERGEHLEQKESANQTLAALDAEQTVLVAIASKQGGRINQHFGHAKEFQIYEVSSHGVKFISHRKIPPYCAGGAGEEDALDVIVKALEGVQAVLCARIGDCPREKLEKSGIEATDAFAHEWIESGISSWYAERFSKEQRQTA